MLALPEKLKHHRTLVDMTNNKMMKQLESVKPTIVFGKETSPKISRVTFKCRNKVRTK